MPAFGFENCGAVSSLENARLSEVERIIVDQDVQAQPSTTEGQAREIAAPAPSPFEAELRHAIGKEQLCLYYQPLADLRTGEMVSVEALVRWQHPEAGLIPPLEFLPQAEGSDLIHLIGDWVLRRACRDLRTWSDNGFPNVRVAVNISLSQFRDPQLSARVSGALSEAGIDPSCLSLEIMEPVLMQDPSGSETILRQLKAVGVSLVLAGFGTGYSSLTWLKRLPFDRVKIERAFVRRVLFNADDEAIVKAIIAMAHHLGIRVVAVGIETEAQCEFLRRHMCDEIQGFFYSPAVAPKEIEAMLVTGRRLPDHLLRLQKKHRTLLLVDDEENILAALRRLLRRDGYDILIANGGQEALKLLAQNEVDVIVSDQRMPGMTGVEFLRTAKGICPKTVRIVLSGYTELQAVTDAVNEGSIYKFLTKPWDDQLLREHIAEAFRHKEMADENQRLDLEVRTADQELAMANRHMEELLRRKQEEIARTEVGLDIVREILRHVAVPVIGADENHMIAFANNAAEALLSGFGSLLGSDARTVLPELFDSSSQPQDAGQARSVCRKGIWFEVARSPMGEKSRSRGTLFSLVKCESKS
ncbi:MAG TPA: EAL domain-containing protein [Noviherbaspirillum sp.]|uniref:EAL domain-containing protein n=1 Tax=Noviherbaspirillum sp. TaxID=1926288 RepID=UPI002D54F0E3|nr:EAL domain-containing protein [Noviherbaspirillum sp.]HYD95911.1 EAL domain-containing protein [Noviherbaspirillum sp.]